MVCNEFTGLWITKLWTIQITSGVGNELSNEEKEQAGVKLYATPAESLKLIKVVLIYLCDPLRALATASSCGL